MFVFSRSFLVAFLLAASTFIACGPLAKTSSSLKNGSTSLSNSSLWNDSSLSYGGNESLSNKSYGLAHELSSDDSPNVVARNDGTNVLLLNPGSEKLRMLGNALKIQANLQHCSGDTFFCYKASRLNPKAQTGCPSNYCGFKLLTDETNLMGMDFAVRRIDFDKPNDPIQMKYERTPYFGTIKDASCDPAFEDGNLLSIEVFRLSPNCQIEISDSQLVPKYVPTLASSGNDEASKTSEAGTPWYAWLVIPFAIVVSLFATGAGIAICWDAKILCFKKYSAPPSSSKPTIIMAPESLKPSMRTIEEIKKEPSVDEKKMKPKKKKDKKKKAVIKEKSLPTAREPTIEATMPSVTCDEISLPITLPLEEYLKLPPPTPEEVRKQKKHLKARSLRRSKYNSIEEAKKRSLQT